jgi:hypothetical protein
MEESQRIKVTPRPLVKKLIKGYVREHNNADPDNYCFMSESKAVNELIMYALNHMPKETQDRYLKD